MSNEIYLVPDKVILQVVKVDDVIGRIREKSSDFVIPEYQRDYVWNSNSVHKLLTSLFKGYPIGSMLIQNTKTGKKKLLDGLQRTFSLIKISDKPLNFLSEDLISYYFETVSNESFDKNLIDSMTRTILMKVKEFSGDGNKVNENQIYGSITDEENRRETIKEFLKYFKDWIDYDFPNINIPHIALTSNYTDKEASEVFGLVNDEGKGLNKYEILSSYWSNFPIDASESTFIGNFINTRIAKFLAAINSTEKKVAESTIEMNNKNVSPANFIYAVFNECINKVPSLRNIYYKGERLRTNALEPIMSIFANYMRLDSLANKNLRELGPKIQSDMTSQKKIEQIVSDIAESMKVVADSISLFNFIPANGNNVDLFDKFGISMAMIASFINTVLADKMLGNKISVSTQGKYLEDWLILETIDGEYDSGSNNRAWKNFKDRKYKKQPKKKVKDVIIEHLESEYNEDTVKQKPSTSTLLILSMLQHKLHKINDLDIDIDHIIPKSLLTAQKLSGHNYINTIGNLQFLDKTTNREIKRDKIIPSKRQYDFLFDEDVTYRSSSDFITNYDTYLELMKASYFNLNDDGTIKVKTTRKAGKKFESAETKKSIKLDEFIKFYKLRHEQILKIIKEKF